MAFPAVSCHGAQFHNPSASSALPVKWRTIPVAAIHFCSLYRHAPSPYACLALTHPCPCRPAVGSALSNIGSLRNELMLPPQYTGGDDDEDDDLDDFMLLGTTPNFSGSFSRKFQAPPPRYQLKSMNK